MTKDMPVVDSKIEGMQSNDIQMIDECNRRIAAGDVTWLGQYGFIRNGKFNQAAYTELASRAAMDIEEYAKLVKDVDGDGYDGLKREADALLLERRSLMAAYKSNDYTAKNRMVEIDQRLNEIDRRIAEFLYEPEDMNAEYD